MENKMIAKLTKEQESRLSEFREKRLTIGLSTDLINRTEAKKQFMIFNKLILDKKENPIIIFMDSPLTAWLATVYLYNIFKLQNEIKSQVRSQVWSQVESQVRSQVES